MKAHTKIKHFIRSIFIGFKVQHLGSKTYIDKVCFQNGKASGHKGIVINDNCFLRSGSVFVTQKNNKKSGIFLKEGVGINRNCYFGGEGGIVVGRNCQIGPHVCIITTKHLFDKRDVPIYKQPTLNESVKLEEDVWIGANATILAGVKIGKGSVVGAGAVVTKDVPPYKVVVGVPAKVIRDR